MLVNTCLKTAHIDILILENVGALMGIVMAKISHVSPCFITDNNINNLAVSVKLNVRPRSRLQPGVT